MKKSSSGCSVFRFSVKNEELNKGFGFILRYGLARVGCVVLFSVLASVSPAFGQQRSGVVELRPRGPSNMALPVEIEPRDFYALIIAPASYQPGWLELPSPVDEAVALGKLLTDSFGFEVQMLTSPTETTQRRITAALDQMPVRQNVLIYFSGHGMIDPGGLSYWVPSDGMVDDYTTWVGHNLVQNRAVQLRKKSKTRHILIVSDSCFSGGLLKGERSERVGSDQWPWWLRERFAKPSIQVLTSGGDYPVVGDTSCQEGDLWFGHFFCALFEALKNPNREVWAAEELHQELNGSMKGIRLPNGRPQIPRFGPVDDAHVGGGEFVFVRWGGIGGTGSQGNKPPVSSQVSVIQEPEGLPFVQPALIPIAQKTDDSIDTTKIEFGYLVVDIVPKDGVLFVNDEQQTPGYFEVSPGLHWVRVERDLYHAHREPIEIAAGQKVEKVIRLNPAFGGLRINSTPSGARVLLDGVEVGITPLLLEKARSGTYQLSVEANLHKHWLESLNILDGKTVSRQLTLDPLFGTVRLLGSPPLEQVRVEVNRKQRKEVPLRLIPGRYSLQISAQHFEPFEISVSVERGQPHTVEYALIPETGVVSVESTPHGAQISLDGRLLGAKTPDIIESVQTGLHRVSLSMSGFKSAEVEIRVLKNQVTDVKKDLIRLPLTGKDRIQNNLDGTVTDLVSGLMWAEKDTKKEVTWKEAKRACKSLDLAGHSDWRLPKIKELEALHDPGRDGKMKVVEGISLSGPFPWSSSKRFDFSSETLRQGGSSWCFVFDGSIRSYDGAGGSGEGYKNWCFRNCRSGHRALCVRGKE